MPSESFLTSFAAVAAAAPEAVALRWNGRAVSYQELTEIADGVLVRLPEYGIEEGAPVCVTGKKSPALVGTLLALFRARHRVLLPAGDLGETTLLRLCELAGCTALVTVPSTVDPTAEPTVRALPASPPVRRVDGPGLLLTTSGSTGLPKIVPLAAAGVDRFIGWAAGQFEIGPDATVLSYAPLNFDLSLLDVWTSLARGATVTLVGEDVATSGPALLDLLAGATVVQAVPMLFRLATDAAPPGTAFDTARHVISTGDVLPAEVLARTRRLFPRADIYNLYGCTETNDSFLHRVAVQDATPLPIGQPIAGVTAAVLDPDGAPLAGPGSGELVVRTPFQADGYLDPSLDAGRFGPAPDGLPPGRWYRTGDLVHRDGAGVLTLVGRADFHVKVRGVRINTQEVETVLGLHAQVAEAAVLAIPDGVAGHRLHAVIRRRPGSTLNSLQLRQHCAARLARTAIPSRVEIVETPLPRTSTGKVDRNQLRLTRQQTPHQETASQETARQGGN